jgi:GMP synthase PP-ATPase subunit
MEQLIGQVTWERVETLRAADAILLEELEEAGLHHLQTSGDDRVGVGGG